MSASDEGSQDAASQVRRVACGVGTCVEDARAVIRGQPIVAALAVCALGYMIGRFVSLLPSHSSAGRR
jgi:hypothetical protein